MHNYRAFESGRRSGVSLADGRSPVLLENLAGGIFERSLPVTQILNK